MDKIHTQEYLFLCHHVYTPYQSAADVYSRYQQSDGLSSYYLDHYRQDSACLLIFPLPFLWERDTEYALARLENSS